MKVLKRPRAFWQSQREALHYLYVEERQSTVSIAKLYGVNPSTISSKLKLFGIPRRRVGDDCRANAKYSVDSAFFDVIDTEEKAYTLGFVLSDGHVSSRSNLMFAVKSDDEDVLHKIKTAMKSNHPIFAKSNGRYSNLMITSKRIADSLRILSLSNHKTFEYDLKRILAAVPADLHRHFLRGVFDGDGSICIYKYDYFSSHTYHFGLTGILDMCDYAKEVLNLNTKLANEGNGIYTLVSSCKADIQRIGHFLYDDATIYMDRKKKTFDRVYALIENNE